MNTLDQIVSADRPALVQRWQSLFDREPPAHVQVALLRRVLAWHVQDEALGREAGTSKSADHLNLALRPAGARRTASLTAGTRLLREWQGHTHEVLVLPEGFEHQGKTYTSLSAVARAITGTPWSGPAFFGVRR